MTDQIHLRRTRLDNNPCPIINCEIRDNRVLQMKTLEKGDLLLRDWPTVAL